MCNKIKNLEIKQTQLMKLLHMCEQELESKKSWNSSSLATGKSLVILFKDGPENKLLTSFPILLFSTFQPDTIFSVWTAMLLEEMFISNIWFYTASVEPQSVSKGSVSKSSHMVITNSKHTQNSLTPTSRHIFTAQKHAHRKHTLHIAHCHTLHKSKPITNVRRSKKWWSSYD